MRLSFIYPQFLWLLLLLPLTAWIAWLGKSRATRRFYFSLAARLLLLLLIILPLSGVQLRLRTAGLTSVFVLDVSDSIPPGERQRGEDFIRQAIDAMPAGDRAAIVLFGKDALVERLASDLPLLNQLSSIPISSGTDIASALQLAQAIFPAEGARRLVLFSDGRQNLGQALEQAELAAASQIELLYFAMGGPQGENEALVERLEAPADVRQGEDYTLTAVIRSSLAQQAALRVFADGELIHSQELNLQAGENRVQIQVNGSQAQAGFRRFSAQVIPDNDTRLQNNQASAFTVVYGPPSILVVEGSPAEGDNLVAALQAAEMQVQRTAPGQMPASLSELAAFDAVILVNVHAKSLPDSAMQALPLFVKDLGKGLLMTGGEDSYGAGGYLRTPLEAALPVDMDVRNRDLQANLALVLAVDKSGSMGRCHCDNPDLNQTYTRAEVGQPKVDIAKEAIMRAASALGEQDFLGVVAFDTAARWVVELAQWVDPFTLEQSIGSFTAAGQTNLASGVQAAYESLQNVDAKRRHVILMTDGWIHAGELTNLAQKMNAEGITLSVIAAGEGSATYLQSLAVAGGGRYYPAADILSVPDIFLKETVQSVGEYIVEDPFYPLAGSPSPLLQGLDPAALPALLGYNGATAKQTARLDLLTPRGDPLLATWQYGLGRAAAWTSDVKGQWASEWLAWEGFPRFSAQLVSSLLPAPRVEGLEASAALQEGKLSVRLQALGTDGRPLNFVVAQATVVDPDLQTVQLELRQTGPGQYEALSEADLPGVYLVRLGANDGDRSLGQITLGAVVPYSPEYLSSGADRGLLEELARRTGGGEILEPLNAFLHNLPAADYAREIWRPLLLLAALLFPLDVGLRRLAVGKEDLAKAQEKLRVTFSNWLYALKHGRRATQPGEHPQILDRLFAARDRGRARGRRGSDQGATAEARQDAPGSHAEARQDAPGSLAEGRQEAPRSLAEARRDAPENTSQHRQSNLKSTLDDEATQDYSSHEIPATTLPTQKGAAPSLEDSLSRLREAKKRAQKK